MKLPLSTEAQRVVEFLRIAAFLNTHRHVHRARLIACMRSSYPELFTNKDAAAVKLARAIILVGTTPDTFSAIARDFNDPIIELFILLYMLDRSVEECTENREEWRRMQLETRVALFEPVVAEEAERFFGKLPGLKLRIAKHPEKIYDSIMHACQVALDRSIEEREERSSRQLYHAANSAWVSSVTQEETVTMFEGIQARFNHAEEEASIACYLATIYLLHQFPVSASHPALRQEQERLLHRTMLELAKFL